MTAALAAAVLVGMGLALLAGGLAARHAARPRLSDDVGYRPDREPAGSLGRLARIADRALPGRSSRSLAAELPRAGSSLSPGEFAVRMGLGAAILALVLGLLIGPGPATTVAGVAVLAVRLRIRVRAGRYRDRFDEELPDALDLLAGSLEAGASLAQAMELVAAEGPPPLAGELRRILADNRLGEPLVDAAEQTARRTGSDDFAWCVRAIRVQQEFGASLADLMRTLGQFMRWRQELRREVQALTAEGRFSSYILMALPFVVAAFVLAVSPGYLVLLVTTPLGWVMTALAAVLMTGGVLSMRRIVKVEV